MTVFIDTNALIDALDDSRPNHPLTKPIMQAMKEQSLKAVVSTQSIVDAAYVCNQLNKMPLSIVRYHIGIITSIMDVCSVDKEDIQAANNSLNPDYEDSVQLSCAARSGCDIIVSGDKELHKYTDLKVITVSQLYNSLFKQQ